MFNYFLIHFLSFLFFRGGFFSEIDWPEKNYGEIVKISESQYFSQKINQIYQPEISASSAVVMDVKKDIFILEKNSDQVWPIASISKLMSTLVIIEDFDLDLEEYYKIQETDRRLGGRDYLFIGDEVKNKDLLALSLIASDNTAVVALISSLGLDEDDFVKLMNEKSEELGLKNTRFKDATGLSPQNLSTAKEVSFLIKRSFTNLEILSLVKEYNYKFSTKQGRVKNIYSTNELLNSFSENDELQIVGGKTGYNDLAGYCLGAKFIINDNQEFISVVLNASTLKNRFSDTKKLAQEIYNFYIN